MNKEYNIKDLLQEHIIIVPEMQRDYVWSVTSDNVYKLLQIIHDGSPSKINIGFIYACGQEGLFCLIDGQQLTGIKTVNLWRRPPMRHLSNSF